MEVGKRYLIFWAIKSWLGPTCVIQTHLIEFDVHGYYIWLKKKESNRAYALAKRCWNLTETRDLPAKSNGYNSQVLKDSVA